MFNLCGEQKCVCKERTWFICILMQLWGTINLLSACAVQIWGALRPQININVALFDFSVIFPKLVCSCFVWFCDFCSLRTFFFFYDTCRYWLPQTITFLLTMQSNDVPKRQGRYSPSKVWEIIFLIGNTDLLLRINFFSVGLKISWYRQNSIGHLDNLKSDREWRTRK